MSSIRTAFGDFGGCRARPPFEASAACEQVSPRRAASASANRFLLSRGVRRRRWDRSGVTCPPRTSYRARIQPATLGILWTVGERTRVQLPAGVGSHFQVFLNGVAQQPGRDFRREENELVFERRLAREGRLGFWRWFSLFLGVAGTYRQNDSVDG